MHQPLHEQVGQSSWTRTLFGVFDVFDVFARDNYRNLLSVLHGLVPSMMNNSVRS